MKGNKIRKGILITSTVVLLLSCIIGLLTMNKSDRLSIGDSELARAMTYEQVKKEDENTNVENVKFDAFFLRDLDEDGNAESIRGTCKEIGKEDTLYMELNVQTAGVLKNAKITINGQNFYLQTTLPKDEQLKDNYIGNNTKEIQFNEIPNGTHKLITATVRSGDYTNKSRIADAIGKDTSKYSKENSVTLTGTYVADDGTETQVSKTANFMIDWYGTTKATIDGVNQRGNIVDAIDEENKNIKVNFKINTQESDEKLIISKTQVNGTIPNLNGYAPIEVKLVGTNGVFNYDGINQTFTIEKQAVLNENGVVKSSVSRNNLYEIQVIYPLEAYESMGTETIELRIPVETYYEGYNNPNSEFNNPYKSNIAKSTIILNYEKAQGSISNFSVTIGEYITNPKKDI